MPNRHARDPPAARRRGDARLAPARATPATTCARPSASRSRRTGGGSSGRASRSRCPEGVAGLVTPRSGLAIEHGLTLLNAPGLIDPNYRGEIKVILHNTSERRYTVEIGDRVAQLLLVPYWAPELEVVDELSDHLPRLRRLRLFRPALTRYATVTVA